MNTSYMYMSVAWELPTDVLLHVHVHVDYCTLSMKLPLSLNCFRGGHIDFFFIGVAIDVFAPVEWYH